MGVGNRMKKQGMPMSLEEMGIGRKRKSTAQDNEPTKLVKLDRALRQQRSEPKIQSKKKKTKMVNPDAQITIPPPMPVAADEDEIEEDLSEDGVDAISMPLPGSDESEEVSGSQSDSMFDSDEEVQQKAIFSEDDDSDAMETLNAANIEGLSRRLDAQQAEIDAEAQAELEEDAIKTNIADDNLLDGADQSAGLTPDLKVLHSRITETVRVLGDFGKLSDKSRSRVDYTQQLISDISIYYSYTPYLAEKLFNLFSADEALAFFEANERPRPVTLRTNTLRTNRRSLAQALINRGVQLAPLGKWTKVGLQVYDAPVPLGATPEYLAGHYILQAASSLLPVIALAPSNGERVLDMAAAPGGKTTHISALMQNTGSVFANDANKVRAKGLIGNIHRLGCKNVIVCNYEAEKAFPSILGGFDRVLLDAPCSGTGVIAKDPSVKTSKTEKDFILLPEMQKKLLLAAIDSVDHTSKGAVIVYSTCSVTVEENERVVQYALSKRPNVKLIDTGLGFGTPGFTAFEGRKFHRNMNLTRRYFPHKENVDGFFVSKFKKVGPTAQATTIINAEAVDNSKTGYVSSTIAESEEETVDGFGGFHSDEDKPYIEKAERNWRKARGLDPRATLNGHHKDSDSKKEKREKRAKREKKEKTDKK